MVIRSVVPAAIDTERVETVTLGEPLDATETDTVPEASTRPLLSFM